MCPRLRTSCAPIVLVAILSILTVACGDDPVSHSAPVGINLKVESGAVVNDTIRTDKGITTESGNPYGKFISDAQAHLGGAEPSRIQLDELTMTLGASSTGVTSFEQIFAGKVEVLFEMADTNNSFAVGSVTDPTGSTDVPLQVSFDSDDFQGEDRVKLLAGGFKVVLRGPVAPGFAGLGAKADVQLTFTFTAYE